MYAKMSTVVPSLVAAVLLLAGIGFFTVRAQSPQGTNVRQDLDNSIRQIDELQAKVAELEGRISELQNRDPTNLVVMAEDSDPFVGDQDTTHAERIRLTEPGILIMTGRAQAERHIPRDEAQRLAAAGVQVHQNAGVAVMLSINGDTCGRNDNYDAATVRGTFPAGATCIRHLPAGEYILRVERVEWGALTQGNRLLEMQYIVLRAQVP